MSSRAALVGQLADRQQLPQTLLRLRTFLYAFVASLMLVASLGGDLERLVSLAAFTLAISAPLFAARVDAARRLELAIVADLVGAFVLWWSMQDAPVVGLILVLWAVAVTSFVPRRRTGTLLLLLALFLELAKLPIAMMERAGWFPWTPAGAEIAEPLTLVVSAGGHAVIVVVAAVVFRSLSHAQGVAMDRALATQDQLRAVFESPIAAFVLFSLDGAVLQVNAAAAGLLKIPSVVLEGSTWFGMLAADDLAAFTEFGSTAGRDARGWMRREIALSPEPGRSMWVVVSVAFIPGHDGQQPMFLAHLQDVTERRKAEDGLRDSELRYRTFFEQIPVAMYRTRPEGEILDGNQALADLLGFDAAADLRGRSAEEFVERADRDDVRARLEAAGVLVGHEYRLRRRDGSVIWVRDTSRVVSGDGDAHYEGALVDVTERRAAERELQARASQQEAVALLGRAALDSDDIAVVVATCSDLVGGVIEGAEAHVVATGDDGGTRLLTEAFGAGVDPASLLTLADAVLEDRDAAGHVTEERSCAVQIPGSVAPIGAIVVVRGCDTLFGSDEVTFVQGLAGVLGAAIERDRARAELEALVESKDEFIASISHEVRTPLTVVAGMAQELQGQWERFGREEIAELVALIVDQSREMEDLVEDLLVAARADIGRVPVHMQEIDVEAEIDQVLSSLATRGRRLEGPGDQARAYADPVRVRQIIRNLVTNAIRYGGEDIRVEVEPNGATVAVRVVDDGAGIPDSERERIFEPYERAHPAAGQPGSVGLGLTVARKLAELMGGDLTYRYDGASVFELTLAKAVDITPAAIR